MVQESDVHFHFKSAGVPDDTFLLVRLDAREALSDLYELQVQLVAADPDIDPARIVNQPATVEIEFLGDVTRFQGIVSLFEQRDQGPEFVNYRAIVVPRLHLLGLTRQNRVFQEKSAVEIIEAVLQQAGLASSDDYELRSTASYVTREYTVQYQETDLEFIQRLMEHEGIFYFFEHGEDREKLVIGDSRSAHVPIQGDSQVLYRDARAVNPGGEAVSQLTFRQQVLPREVHLKDYNYRKPSLVPEGGESAVSAGAGAVKTYGEHFKTPDDGKSLARIRAEEIRCREKLYFGASACRHFRCGQTFTLQDHFREASNIEFLLTEVVHTGRQAGVVGTAYGGDADRSSYTNDFQAIPADVPFRPARLTPRPRIHGIMNAHVDASSDGHYAELDDQGRYKVKLPFDLSGLGNGKASRFIRMAQPYGGHGDAPREYGFHLPLHKGTEVLLTHVDGDPDRPIIAAAVPNPATASPVIDQNETQAILRTAAQNELVIEDKDDVQYCFLQTPRHTTYLSLGNEHDPFKCPHGIAMGTEKGVSVHAGEGIIVAAGSKLHQEGVDNSGSAFQDVTTTAAKVTALAALAGGLAADTAAGWNIASLVGAIGDLGGAVAGMTAPGIYMSAPGKIALCAAGEAVLGAMGSADVIAAGPANILSASEAMVAGVMGAAVVARRNVEVVSAKADVKVHANDGNIEIEAKKDITINSGEENLTVTVKKGITMDADENDVAVTARKNISLQAAEEAFTAQAKKKVEITSEEEDVAVAAKQKKVVVEGGEEIQLKCGQASITLKKDGKIEIKGMTVEIKGTQEFKASGAQFTIEGQAQGTIKASGMLEVSASGPNTIKGTPVMIN